jgi:SEC-C motif-containing protein
MKTCPCGSGRPYAEHAVDYIIDTCVRDGEKQEIDRKSTQDWSEKSEWLGLKILSVTKGTAADTEGTVEFEAAYTRNGLRDTHHETAQFKKIDGQWLYDDGEVAPVTIVRSGPKIGRNEPCPCGSGKKYKHCCGAK